MAQNKDLVADAQTLLEENLSEKKSVESARRLATSSTTENFKITKQLKVPICQVKLSSQHKKTLS